MSSLRALLIGAVAVVVAGCAALDSTVDAADMAGVSKIGVVSGLSNELNHIQVGANFFSNDWQYRMVPEWNMPGISEVSLAAALQNAPNIGEVGIVDTAGLNRAAFADNKAALLGAARMQGFDVVALIMPMWPQSQSKLVPGYGVMRSQSFGIVNLCIYQQTMIYVLDVATGKQLAREHGYNVWDGSCRDSSVPFKTNVHTYSDVEMGALKEELRSAFDFGFERSVRKLGFGTRR